MRQRDWIVVAFCIGAFAGVAGLTWLMTRDKPGTKGPDGKPTEQVAGAADAKPISPQVLVVEQGPVRKTEQGIEVRAYRQQKGGEAATYGVKMSVVIVALEDAEDLVRFYEKYKDKSKSNAKEIDTAEVWWRDKNGLGVQLNLNTGKWLYAYTGELAKPAEFFATISAAIADAKAMKTVPFSVTP